MCAEGHALRLLSLSPPRRGAQEDRDGTLGAPGVCRHHPRGLARGCHHQGARRYRGAHALQKKAGECVKTHSLGVRSGDFLLNLCLF